MTNSATPIRVPFSKRVIAVALAGLVTLGIQKVLPGYHVDPAIQGAIDLGVASFAGWAVTEERKYLTLALAKLSALGK